MALRLSHLIGVSILHTHRCCSLLLACIHCVVLHNVRSTVLTTCYSARTTMRKVIFLSLPDANLSTEVALTATVSWFN